VLREKVHMYIRDRFGWSGTDDIRDVIEQNQGIHADTESYKDVHESYKDAQVQVKKCPRCGQLLFADMNVCYGCLYDFIRGEDPGELVESTCQSHDLPLPQLEEVLMRDGPECDDPIGATTSIEPKETCQVDPERGVATLWIRTGDVDVAVPIPDRGLRIGRAPANDIVLHSQAVSRAHIVITEASGGIDVHDLGSTNPALFQGRPIEGTVLVPYGETLLLCGTHLVPRRIY
jgi:hypothetical protein